MAFTLYYLHNRTIDQVPNAMSFGDMCLIHASTSMTLYVCTESLKPVASVSCAATSYSDFDILYNGNMSYNDMSDRRNEISKLSNILNVGFFKKFADNINEIVARRETKLDFSILGDMIHAEKLQVVHNTTNIGVRERHGIPTKDKVCSHIETILNRSLDVFNYKLEQYYDRHRYLREFVQNDGMVLPENDISDIKNELTQLLHSDTISLSDQNAFYLCYFIHEFALESSLFNRVIECLGQSKIYTTVLVRSLFVHWYKFSFEQILSVLNLFDNSQKLQGNIPDERIYLQHKKGVENFARECISLDCISELHKLFSFNLVNNRCDFLSETLIVYCRDELDLTINNYSSVLDKIMNAVQEMPRRAKVLCMAHIVNKIDKIHGVNPEMSIYCSVVGLIGGVERNDWLRLTNVERIFTTAEVSLVDAAIIALERWRAITFINLFFQVVAQNAANNQNSQNADNEARLNFWSEYFPYVRRVKIISNSFIRQKLVQMVLNKKLPLEILNACFCEVQNNQDAAAIIMHLINESREYYFVEFTGTGSSYIYNERELKERFKFTRVSIDKMDELKIENINGKNSQYKINGQNYKEFDYSNLSKAATAHQGTSWQVRFHHIVRMLMNI